MTDNTDIVNLALQKIGTRTTVTSAELAAQSSNEAIQANLVLLRTRDELLRKAPWNCGKNFVNLTLITAAPGTPENATQGAATWQKGIPAPPWAYEYQYPVNCLKPLFVVPQFTTGFASGVPITTAVTGIAPTYWNGPPARFQVGIDQFVPMTAAVVAAGGAGYVVGDGITLAGTPAGSNPIGAPAKLIVATIGGGGAVATVTVVPQTPTETGETIFGGSYFQRQTSPIAQGSTTGVGTGATFTCTFAAVGVTGDQRVIYTNQEQAILAYVKQVTDPNVMDQLFVDAWCELLGARMAMALTGDKALANARLGAVNQAISDARTADGNEGLTINNVTPDWIRIRGIEYTQDLGWSPNYGVDWGALFPLY